jgi:hypothetical protein
MARSIGRRQGELAPLMACGNDAMSGDRSGKRVLNGDRPAVLHEPCDMQVIHVKGLGQLGTVRLEFVHDFVLMDEIKDNACRKGSASDSRYLPSVS